MHEEYYIAENFDKENKKSKLETIEKDEEESLIFNSYA